MPRVLRVVVALVAVWLLLPALVVIPLGFSGAGTFVFPPPSWSTQWFENLFSDEQWRDALAASLRIAFLVVVLAVVLGTMAALGLDRSSFRGKGAVQGLLLAPTVVPVIIFAVGVYAVFLPAKLTGTDIGFVLADTALALPFVVVSVSISLAGYDRRLEDAAASLGSSPLSTFFRVTLPNILPGVFAGAMFAFITSFDELVVAIFMASPSLKTLPVQMWSTLQVVDLTLAAAASLLLLATTAVTLIALLFGNARELAGSRR